MPAPDNVPDLWVKAPIQLSAILKLSGHMLDACHSRGGHEVHLLGSHRQFGRQFEIGPARDVGCIWKHVQHHSPPRHSMQEGFESV